MIAIMYKPHLHFLQNHMATSSNDLNAPLCQLTLHDCYCNCIYNTIHFTFA